MPTFITRGRSLLASLLALSVTCLSTVTAMAEVAEVRLARQFGVVYAPILIMEQQKLIEKHAAAQGLPDLKVAWTQFAGPAIMNDAILSNSIDFTAQGLPSLATLWDRTRNTIGVKGVAAINDSPVYLDQGVDPGDLSADRGRKSVRRRQTHPARSSDRWHSAPGGDGGSTGRHK
jgi:ABC-type nitrate/sulfonate/bicarbonate transport system substrate-binding protein